MLSGFSDEIFGGDRCQVRQPLEALLDGVSRHLPFQWPARVLPSHWGAKGHAGAGQSRKAIITDLQGDLPSSFPVESGRIPQ